MFLVSLIFVACLAASELPSEATLPGKRAVPRDLPSEATLPGQSQSTVPVNRPPLPDESVLPPGFVIEQPKSASDLLVEFAREAEPLRTEDSSGDNPATQPNPGNGKVVVPAIGQVPVGQPWLRLNMRGHVGIVRTLAYTTDGARLLSAGDDKTVEVWTRLGAEGNRHWGHERAIRWPVQRGPRGRIHVVATAPNVLAMAGYGSLGGLGEIWLVDSVTGELKRALIDEQVGHRQVVAGLAFAPKRADILASQDVDGRVLVWQQDAKTGMWTVKQLVKPDAESLKPEDARALQASRRFAPVVMPDDRHVIVASFAGWQKAASRPDPFPSWKLDQIDILSGGRVSLPAENLHLGSVMALAATADGRTLASSDTFGNLHLWNLTDRSLASRQRQNVGLSALAWSQDGRRLVTGSASSAQRGGKAVWQVWQVTDPRQPQSLADIFVDQEVHAVAVSPRGDEFAYCQGSEIHIRRFNVGVAPERLRGLSRPVLRVAFAAKPPDYRVAVGTRRSADGKVALEHSFDMQAVKLDGAKPLREEDWLDQARWRGDWSLRTVRDQTGEVHWLYHREERAARLPLDPTLHGKPSAWCWLPDREGQPLAVAVGTSLQGNIFIFRLAANGTASILRQFRAHEGGVRSISVSRDRRYLCSGADDATVRIWSLAGFDQDEPLVNRWGTRFEIRDGKLVAAEVREDGPLYFRGIRTDDVVHSIAWPVGSGKRTSDRAEEMLQQLLTNPWDTQVVFDCRRRDMQVEGIQMLPAWQPLAALFVADNREWAFWTPAGYYDASFDGHKLFGWQVNRGVDMLPEFFLAAQMRQALERPMVLNQLLSAGSLPAALRAAPDPPPGEGQDAVLPQYRLKPRIEILAPRPDEQLAEQRVTIRARISVRDGVELIPPKAFANGVVAPVRQLLEELTVTGGKEFTFEWNAVLPSDPRILIQVVASTDAEVSEQQTVQIRTAATDRPRAGRLYVFAAGVNNYHDAQIQQLDFAVNNVRRVVETLQEGVSDSDTALLLDDQATRPMWSLITADYAERLRREVSPNDLIVFFLSGHGLRDEQTDRYFYVTAHAKYDDLKSQRFGDCLSFTDFAAFADVPCRKLAILDTCHSGAVQQPLRQQDLKAAIRALQDDVIFTMTASEGTEEAAEAQNRRLGRFTARLIEALEGAADEAARGGDANGLVTLQEASAYVRATVAADSSQEAQQQHPTAGPIDLLEFADFPLNSR